MSKLNKKDRASLCLFTFSDGRRCRTPRIRNHPHFCFDHAQKEARARTAETIGEDLAYFFSGDYLSACDLSTALARILPAVVRGDIKPKTARTVAYLAQTLLQSIRLAQHEYIEALSTNGWRRAIANSVNQNHDYLVPPNPASPQTQSPQPAAAPPPQPTAPTVETLNVGAGLVYHEPRREPGPHVPPAPPIPPPAQPAAVIPNPVASSANGGEGSASSPAPSPTSPPISQSPATQPAASAAPLPKPASPARPEERREPLRELPKVNPAPTTPPPPAPPDRSAHWLEWDNIQGGRPCNKLL